MFQTNRSVRCPRCEWKPIFHLNWGEPVTNYSDAGGVNWGELAIHSDQGGCQCEVILFNVILVASWMKRHQNVVNITNMIEYCQAIYALWPYYVYN